MPGVGLAVKVAGLGPKSPDFEPLSAIELTLGGVEAAGYLSEVGETSTGALR